jgi:RecB family exonuclease
MNFRQRQATVGLGSKLAPKPFAASWSRLNNFETCPKRSYHLDIAKDVEEEKTPELLRGDALHGAMAARVRSNIKLPVEFTYMETWAEKLSRHTHDFQTIQVEQRYGLSKTLEPTFFMEKKTYWRTVIDYLKLIPGREPGTFLAHIVDYKTGRPKDGFDQLALYAMTVFAHLKDVTRVRADFLWTEYNDTTHENFERSDMQDIWDDILPRVIVMEQAYEKKEFPPKPCGLCKEYCPVRTCEHNGRRVKA